MANPFLSCSAPYLRQALSLNLELIGQTALPVSLWDYSVSTSQCWDYRHMLPHLTFKI